MPSFFSLFNLGLLFGSLQKLHSSSSVIFLSHIVSETLAYSLGVGANLSSSMSDCKHNRGRCCPSLCSVQRGIRIQNQLTLLCETVKLHILLVFFSYCMYFVLQSTVHILTSELKFTNPTFSQESSGDINFGGPNLWPVPSASRHTLLFLNILFCHSSKYIVPPKAVHLVNEDDHPHYRRTGLWPRVYD